MKLRILAALAALAVVAVVLLIFVSPGGPSAPKIVRAKPGATRQLAGSPFVTRFTYPQWQTPIIGDTTTPGSWTQGDTASSTTGTWTGNPSSYAYQWQDCNTQGQSCSNINGATASTYTLAAGDVGSTVRTVVTACNPAGCGTSSSAVSPPVTGISTGNTLVGAPSPAGVTCTTTLNAGANVSSAVSGSAPGSTVCLNQGSWAAISLSGLAPASPGVTVAATPGQNVSVPGFSLTGDQNITIEGFFMNSGVGNGSGDGIDIFNSVSGIGIKHNTIEQLSGGYGIRALANGTNVQNTVDIEYNQMDNAGTFIEAQGGTCGCATPDTNWMIAHNVFGPNENLGAGGHYIEGQWIGATIDNNAFEGPTVFNSGAHNNVLHCYTFNAPGCQNVTFANNIMWHAQSRAQTVLITDNTLQNITVSNNLTVDDPQCNSLLGGSLDCPASPSFEDKAAGLTLTNNTSANSAWSVNMSQCGDGCPATTSGYDIENNIATGPALSGQNSYGSYGCQSSCTTGHNVSQDNTATIFGGSGNVINWTPNWQNTTWTPSVGQPWSAPPSNYYKPVLAGGILVTMGWQGTFCSASVTTNCIGP